MSEILDFNRLSAELKELRAANLKQTQNKHEKLRFNLKNLSENYLNNLTLISDVVTKKLPDFNGTFEPFMDFDKDSIKFLVELKQLVTQLFKCEINRNEISHNLDTENYDLRFFDCLLVKLEKFIGFLRFLNKIICHNKTVKNPTIVVSCDNSDFNNSLDLTINTIISDAVMASSPIL